MDYYYQNPNSDRVGPLGAVWYAVYYVKLCKNCDDALPESTLLR